MRKFIVLPLLILAPLLRFDVIVQGPPCQDHVLYLLDVSGSMTQWKREQLARVFRFCLQKFGDDGKIRVAAFSHTVTFHGTEWVDMPNKDEVEKIEKWLQSIESVGETNIGNAVYVGYTFPEIEKPYSIIMITDGYNTSGQPKALTQAAIKEKGVKIPILAVGVDPPEQGFELLKWLAKETGGGFYNVIDKSKKF